MLFFEDLKLNVLRTKVDLVLFMKDLFEIRAALATLIALSFQFLISSALHVGNRLLLGLLLLACLQSLIVLLLLLFSQIREHVLQVRVLREIGDYFVQVLAQSLLNFSARVFEQAVQRIFD